MGTVTSTGLGSGLEINSIVESLVEAEKAPQLDKINKEAETAAAQISALGQVNSLLSSLKSSYSSLNKTSTYNSAAATSSDSSIVTATTGFGADTGTYQVEVQALAQQHTVLTDDALSYGTVNDVVGGGTIQIRFGAYSGAGDSVFTPDANSTNQSISISANATLTEVRDTINKGEHGVTASILYDGTSYRLTLQSDKSGANSAMEITVTDDDGNNTNNSGLSVLAYGPSTKNMDQSLAAQDALMVINGVTIKRDSNSVSEVIDGLTFELNNAEVGKQVKIGVTKDTSTIESEIRAFVDKYNEATAKMTEVTAFRSTTDKGVLIGDASVRSIQSFMRSILNTRLENIDGSIKSMADLGIVTKRDGTLEINEDTTNGQAVFSQVLANNISDVAKFFAKSGNSTSSGINYISSSSLTKEGDYAVEVTQVATQGTLTGAATLPANFSTTPFVVNESNNAFVLRVDGIKSNEINLTNGSYSTEAALIAEIQSQINSDATLKDKGVAVNIAIENQKLVIKSNTYGASSMVAVLSEDDSVTGSAALDFSAPPVNIAATSTFDISLGGSLGSIDVQGSYNTSSDFTTALEAAILAQTGKTATASITDQKLTIKSSAGEEVIVSNLGATTAAELGLSDSTGASDLGLSVGSGTAGVDTVGTINGAAGFGDGQFLLAQSDSGDANGLKVQINSGTFTYTSTNSISAYSFTAPADTTFQLNVDGVLSTSIDISGQNFTSDSDLTTAIQTLLDADANLTAAGESVNVSVSGGKLQFTSTSAGSQLSIAAVGAGSTSDLGLATGSASFKSTVSYSEGITTKIDTFLDAMIDSNISNVQGDLDVSDGLIDGKIDSLYKKLLDIDKQEEELNFRMDNYETRLFKQFNAMDILVAQLGSTSSALQGALDALPGYTREK